MKAYFIVLWSIFSSYFRVSVAVEWSPDNGTSSEELGNIKAARLVPSNMTAWEEEDSKRDSFGSDLTTEEDDVGEFSFSRI